MNRRTLLTSAGVVLSLGVGGCNSLTDGESEQNASNGTAAGDEGGATPTEELTTVGGEASFARLRIGGPSNVTVGDTFNLPISAANVGGQNGTFSRQLVVTGGNETLNRTITIENVESGETGQTVAESLNFTNADRYTFAIEGTDTTKTVAVEPITLQPGESYTLGNDLRVTVESVRFQPVVRYATQTGFLNRDEQRTELLRAGSGQILLIARIALENVGTSDAEFSITPISSGFGSESSPPTLQVAQGSWYTEFEGESLGAATNIQGSPLTGTTLSAGQRASGWALAQVPREAATGTVFLTNQRNATGTPPEVRWAVAPEGGSSRALPRFTLDSFEIPASREINSGVPYTVSVTNEGDGPGTFRGVLDFTAEAISDRAEVTTFSADLDAGGSRTFEGTHEWPYVTTNTYRLLPFGETPSVEMSLATRSYGESYTTPWGREIMAATPVVANAIQFPEGEPAEAGSGQQWVVIEVTVTLPNADTNRPPQNTFTLQGGGRTFDVERPGIGGAGAYTAPTSGDEYQDIEPAPQTATSGLLSFRTPSGLAASDLALQFRVEPIGYPPYIAVWGGASNATTASNSTSGNG